MIYYVGLDSLGFGEIYETIDYVIMKLVVLCHRDPTLGFYEQI